jgi:hypothetical protein
LLYFLDFRFGCLTGHNTVTEVVGVFVRFFFVRLHLVCI